MRVFVMSGVALEIELPASAPAAPDDVRAPSVPTADKPVVQLMPKRTWQPNRLKRRRTHGFLRCVFARAVDLSPALNALGPALPAPRALTSRNPRRV